MIENYSFGKILINGKEYNSDLIIFKDRICDNWWRKESHNLCMDDIEEIINKKPDILIIGTGYFGLMKVPKELIENIKLSGIKQVMVEKTGDACTEYNKLYKKNNIIAAFHLTC
ncbi:MAG: MTH938/NDUFAF3 family protein [Atribacterota bacterium]|nr:MTH938/NDUFAF3 family protein [Atribacterota bacterium]